MKAVVKADIVSMKTLTENVCDMTIYCPEIAAQSVPGQFVELYPDNGINLLARPISICEINEKKDSLRLVFQIVGKGTKLFSALKKGDSIRVLGPCGNGFSLKGGTSVIVGGGIGVPPLLELCKNLSGEKIAVLGFRSAANAILIDDFRKYTKNVYVTTDDGSLGSKGNVIDLMKKENITGDMIYSCGPKIMLEFLSEYASEHSIPCQVSLEERMACGIGACVGCIARIKDENGQTNKKVCKEGPVFDSKVVCWQ